MLQDENSTILKQFEQLKREIQFTSNLLKEKIIENKKLKQTIDSSKPQIDFFEKFSKISVTIQNLVQNEIQNYNRKKNGRRFDEQTKIFCLYIYLSSPKTYKILKSIFNWPSTKILKSHIDTNFQKCGLHSSTLLLLQNCQLEPNERQFILIFDEVINAFFLNFKIFILFYTYNLILKKSFF